MKHLGNFMARLHLRPAPSAAVIRFPNSRAEDREAVIAGLANHQAVLIANNGSYIGRHKFIEAAVAVAVRMAVEVDGEHDLRAAMLDAFDHELAIQFPATA